MQSTKVEEYYSLLKDLIDRDEYQQKIHTLQQHYDNLINQETAALILVDQYGRNKNSYKKIKNLEPNIDCSIHATIAEIQEPRTFTKKNGKPGQLVELTIQDDTGTIPLILWNDDVQRTTKDGDLKLGTPINVINAYTRTSYTGELQLNLGRWSERQINDSKHNKKEEEDQKIHLTGILTEKQPTTPHINTDGSVTFTSTISLKTKNSKQPSTIRLENKQVKTLQDIPIGSILTLQNLTKTPDNIYRLNGDTKDIQLHKD